MFVLKKIAKLLIGAVFMVHAATVHAQFQQRTLRVSNGIDTDHPNAHGIFAMIDCTLDKSGGQMRIRPFWNNALGDDTSAIQSARTGSVDMVLGALSPLTNAVPELGILDLPFLFNSDEEAYQVLDGEVGDWLFGKLPAIGLVGLGWWGNDFRHATNSRRTITKLEDFAGLKMRVMQSPVHLDTFTTLGTNAVPMAAAEIYSALETSTVDGQENSLATIKSNKFYEVQKHLTLSKHVFATVGLVISKKTWDDFSDAERTVLQQCAIVGRDVERRVMREQVTELLHYLRNEGGLQVSEIADDEMQRIRAQTAAVHTRAASVIGQETVDRFNAALQKIRAQ